MATSEAILAKELSDKLQRVLLEYKKRVCEKEVLRKRLEDANAAHASITKTKDELITTL